VSNQLDRDITTALERIIAHTPEAGPTPVAMLVSPDELPRRRWVLPAACVLAIAGVVAAGVLIQRAERVATTDAPASQSQNTSDAPATAHSTVPAPTFPASELTDFPIIGTEALSNDQGSYSLIGADNPASVAALIARRDGDTLTGGIQIEVASALPEQFGAPEPVIVHGVDVAVYTEPGTPSLRTVVFPGTPTLLVRGLDPVEFLQTADADLIRVVDVTAPTLGHPTFTLSFGTLPSGYDIVVAPFELPRGTTNAATAVVGTEASDGSLIEVSLMNPLPAWAVVGMLTAVDVNGIEGWISSGAGNAVIWEPTLGTYASVVGASSREAALTTARRVTFVDEATWRAFYGVAPPSFGGS
jgi:hypothetical protein